jgi:hypothetical protein
MHYAGPGWMYAVRDPDCMIAYYPSPFPIELPEVGYPAVLITRTSEWDAILEMNSRLRKHFPGDSILVLIPPIYPDFQDFGSMLRHIFRLVRKYVRMHYL